MTSVRNLLILGLVVVLLAVLPGFLSPNLVNASIKMLIAALFALAFTLAMAGGHALVRPCRLLRARRIRGSARDVGRREQAGRLSDSAHPARRRLGGLRSSG